MLGWGEVTNFAIYWLNLVTKRTIRLRWKFKLRIMDQKLTKNCSCMVLILSYRFPNFDVNFSVLGIVYMYINLFEIITFLKITACISFLFCIAKGLATFRLGV